MEAAFELVTAPSLTEIPAFRLVHARVRGAYVPWSRFQTLDLVAETLERHGVERTGPAWGVYHDLPYSTRDVEDWCADFGFPVRPDASIPPLPQLRATEVPATPAVGLRYKGDLTSFPGALQFLVEWAARKEVDLDRPLLQCFHVSNALTGEEERDVFVALRSLPWS